MAPGNWSLGLYHLLNQLYGRVNEGAASLWELSSDAAPSSVLMSYYVLLDDLQGIFGKQKKYIKVNFSIWSDGVVCFTLFVPGLYLYTCIDLHVLNHTVLLEGIQLDYSIRSFNVLNSVCKYFYWFVGGVCTRGTIYDFLGSNWSHQAWQWVSCAILSASQFTRILVRIFIFVFIKETWL